MGTAVTIRGRRDLLLPDSFRGNDEFSWERREFELPCPEGDRVNGEWGGVPVDALLDAAGVPDRATHLLLLGEDGYQAPVPLAPALRGLVAFRRVDGEGDVPRFLAPEVDCRRSVCRLDHVSWLSIDEDRDPLEFATW